MEEAPAMAIRRSDKAVPLPPQSGSSRRRRAPGGAAWPAFPGEGGLGIGCGKRSPAPSPAAAAASGNIADGSSCRSPFSSSSRVASFGSGAAMAGAGIRRNSSDLAGDRVSSGCGGIKSPGIGKKNISSSSSSCCDSCRPCSSSSHQHGTKGSGRIEYSDVFGGPPKYLASAPTGRNAAIPDYDDIFQGGSKRSSSSSSSSTSFSFQQQSSKTKSRTTELPVFDLPVPERDTGEVFKGSSEELPKVPVAAASPPPAEEIVYDDVFGGPLTGPRTKLLKDLLRCSGFAEAKRKPGVKTKLSSQSDSSPVSSIHSMCREPHGNPIFEYESEVYGDAKHFNSPHKSSLGSVDKSPQQTFVGLESNRKQPAVTSVSATSSPFTEQFDDSTVHSYSTRASKGAKDPVGVPSYEKVYKNVSKVPAAGDAVPKMKTFGREVDLEVASSSSSESSEQEYLRKASTATRHTYKTNRKHRSSKTSSHRRSSRTRREASHVPGQTSASNGQKSFGSAQATSSPFCDSSAAEQDFDYEVELSTDPSIKCFPRKAADSFTYDDGFSKKEKQVNFVTVNHVQLTTEPTVLPPARPAPSKNVDFLSEKDMSDFLETDAFMEYSIKDLDGLVAEEYVVSQGSVSESSPSVSNSIKTSPSGRSYEDEDSDHCYAKDAVSPDPDPEPKPERGGCAAEQKAEVQKIAKDSGDHEQMAVEQSSGGSEEKKLGTGALNVGSSKSSLEETSSSSLSAEEQPKCVSSGSSPANVSDDLSSLCEFEVIDGEHPERRKSRLERHQRAVERVAKALAEKNNRDLELERVQEEKQRVAELLNDVIKRWAAGKQGNLRALLSTLQYILWPECGWQPISLIDIIEPASVRKAYKKATLYVHPDKLQQKNASTEHKYIAEKVFDLLQEAWTTFNLEQAF
ncbi:J domain-containing protein required for chloroplast accumulation response 1 isoform X2 [Selaginella moellendorffii]|uniref:J domain-containing protein required for chloroplast accumulation response 1 isoform X2 n=1 Tax=Selaginella moellendorffii TaxID=88036 RepID=UPI000D1C5B3E|nr:J domain-containing protein required for chloroplast accumulation response 1 isoform X2 [Selaginella moellendorffii]|eukprot:XP_024517216.1 J domain-containing protein required for chloroplast accumulation response 1 isoform X2 [Selaginella moellendorffii]